MLDVVTPDEVRVGSSAYLQAWTQAGPSSIRFGGLNGRTWDETAGHAPSATYNADVYVFAFVTERDHASYDPLDPAQRTFWVGPGSIVAATGQTSLALSRVEALAATPVLHDELAEAVRAAATDFTVELEGPTVDLGSVESPPGPSAATVALLLIPLVKRSMAQYDRTRVR